MWNSCSKEAQSGRDDHPRVLAKVQIVPSTTIEWSHDYVAQTRELQELRSTRRCASGPFTVIVGATKSRSLSGKSQHPLTRLPNSCTAHRHAGTTTSHQILRRPNMVTVAIHEWAAALPGTLVTSPQCASAARRTTLSVISPRHSVLTGARSRLSNEMLG